MPSPAVAVAVLALFVALTSSSFADPVRAAATKLVTGKQIKKNAVTSKHIKNGSLTNADFKRGTLPRGPQGPAGAPGSQGAPGPQGAQGPQGPAGTAKAWAYVEADGSLGGLPGDGELSSKGMDNANVLRTDPGVYCIKGLSFQPRLALVTARYAQSSLPAHMYADVVAPGAGNPCQVMIRSYDGAYNPSDAGFSLLLE
jgi:hypothetical protein